MLFLYNRAQEVILGQPIVCRQKSVIGRFVGYCWLKMGELSV